MPKKHINPHDRFFRSSMQNPKVAHEFFMKHLPEQIKSIMDFGAVQLEPNSFIDDKLKLQITDMLYKTRLKNQPGYIYILVEQQSSQQALMPFRILKYMLAIMDHHLETVEKNKKPKQKRLPLIYPLIFYSGKNPYTCSTDLFELFRSQHKALARQTLFGPYQLINLPQMSDEEFEQFMLYGTIAKIMKYIHKYKDNILILFEKMQHDLKKIVKLEEIRYIELVFSYFFEAGTVADYHDFIAAVQRDLSDIDTEIDEELIMSRPMTIANQLRAEGRQQGRHEGMQQGRETERIKIASNLLDMPIEPEKISAMTELPLAKVLELATAKRKKRR